MARISIPTVLRPRRLGFVIRKLLRLDRDGPVQREAVMDVGDDAVVADREALVRLLYKAVFGREVDSDALEVRLAALARGESFADMFRDAATSEEERNRLEGGSPPVAVAPATETDEEDRKPLVLDAIRFAYLHFLDRAPTAEDLTFWSGVILSGQPIERFLSNIAQSDEARFKAGQRAVGAGLSDGEFVMAAGEALFGRVLMPTESVVWQRRLESGNLTRAEMIRTAVGERICTVSQPASGATANDSDICQILGTSRMLTRDQWNRRADELRPDRRAMPDSAPLEERQFRHTGQYAVSMIASLYRGRAFIETFLENIVSQTLFDRSELIIVDANSPEHEGNIIEAYRKIYPNIVYKRINYCLGIYDAWNVGVEMARSSYLTNTNLDDLRRADSIALQAAFLDAEPEIDVVYQDFYYSFDPDLTFEQVAAFGFKSELPILTPHNLQLFNSPHNAPMWRRSLHDEMGLFDTRYRSAGDYEFWARCLAAGRSFGKINTPHVVYYQNPKGISTRPDTRGVEEARDVLRRHGRRLTRRALLQSRGDLHAGLGIEASQQGDSDGRAYYDVIQDALIDLGGRSMPKRATSPRDAREVVGKLANPR